MTHIIIPKSLFSTNVKLPYIIKYPSNKIKIGMFGDSMVELAETAMNTEILGCGEANNISDDPAKRPFSHEKSWLYYLSMIGNFEVHSYGISGAGEEDIAYLFNQRTIEYDLNIIHHTNFNRSNIGLKKTKDKFIRKFFERIKKPDCINISCQEEANKILKMDLINDVPFSNPVVNTSWASADPLDLEIGFNHMSNRGNLILALKVLDLVKDKIGI